MDRRVEVCSRVLAAAEIIPVMIGAMLVVVGDFLDAERSALAELRRENNGWKFGRKRMGQVDHPHAAIGDIADKIGERWHDF